MDEVFRALNDPSRRLLLDRLFDRDGQTLGELCEYLPEMTRFGVMSHLRVLEEAGLISTRKAGRNKHHYLNPVPIRLIHDRWISKYTEPVVDALARLKTGIEAGGARMPVPTHVYQTFIKATPEAVWNAITNGDMTVQYYYETRVESDWEPGSPLRYLSHDGQIVADGEVLIADAPKRLEMTFHARWDPKLEEEGPVRMAWVIEPANELCLVSVEYFELDKDSATFKDFNSGLPFIVAGLKTLLETGEPLGSAW